jgi:Domain of unknown function (DU1801)
MTDQAGAAQVSDVLAALDDATAADARAVMDLMHRISDAEPQVWNVGTIGYGTYRYHYDSGRQGEGHALGFYPRKGKTTVYLMDGTGLHADLLAGLGTHTTSRVCIYLKRLSDIDLGVLEQVLRASYANLTEQDGNVKRV